MKNWDRKKLSELSKKKDAVVSGPFGSNLKVSDYKNEGVPILRLQNIGKGFFIEKEIKFISKPKAEELKYHSFISGDIALAKLGIPIGKTCIIPDYLKSGIITADIVRIRPDKNIVNYCFLEYFLNTDYSVSQLTGNISGATRPRVNLSDVRNIEVPIPPLFEQQRIVTILDDAFASIAKAKANTEQNLKNAKELFECYLQTIFTNKGEDWEVKLFGEVCEFVRGPFGGSLKKNIFKSEGYAVYEQQHAIYDQFDDIRYFIDEKKFNEMKRFELNSGDLIMSCSGTMGKMAIVPKNIKKGIINQALLKLKPTKKISVAFLKLWMKSESFQESLKAYSQGAAIQNVASVKILKGIMIPVPSMKEQQSIVQKLNTFSTETKKLATIYQKKIDDLEELKKSVLQKAFNGELIGAVGAGFTPAQYPPQNDNEQQQGIAPTTNKSK